MISKILLLIIGVMQLLAGSWAASIVFKDTTLPIASIEMMGMLGSLFHSAIIFASLGFRAKERRIVALLLLVWHIPEAILIATLGMGVPESQQMVGIITHGGFGVLALVSWYLMGAELATDVQ